MDSLSHLKHLYRFNDWANRIIVESVSTAGSDKARGYLAHVLITEQEYFNRLYGKDSTGFDFWPELSIEECEELAMHNAGRYGRLLAGLDENGLEQTARYKTSKGQSFQNTFREVFTHVLFHSMNHRGQILTILRTEGHTPPEVDYIVFERIGLESPDPD